MEVQDVTFFSGGLVVRGRLHLPDSAVAPPWPTLVAPCGWMETMCSNVSEPFHKGLAEAGFAVLAFDYRGWGASEGEPGWVRPSAQVEDVLAAVAFVEAQENLDVNRLGMFGLGGTGGGTVIYSAAAEPRVKAIAVQSVVADGELWMRGMRREYEWQEFRARVASNRVRRALTNEDELVNPTEELMVSSPERRSVGMPVRGDQFHLSSAEELLRFRPVDVVGRIAPRAVLVVCVDDDVVTPPEHALALYRASGQPKRLVRQHGITHYQAYSRNFEGLMVEFTNWYRQYLVNPALDGFGPEPADV